VSRPSVALVNLGSAAALADQGVQAIGGEEFQHALLARALADRGWKVSVVSSDFGQGLRSAVGGVPIEAAYPPDAGWPVVRFIWPRWIGLERALLRSNADLHYVSCAGTLVGQVALHCRSFGRKMVFRVASDSDCDPARWLVGSAKDRAMFRLGLNRADVIAVQTDHQISLVRQHFDRPTVRLPMLVDRPQRPRPAAERDIDLLWVANLRALKRPELFVALAQQLASARCHLVGGAADNESEVARSVAEAVRSVTNLTWHGRLSYTRTRELFARARLFVSTSRIEGFPNTFLQAWAHGVPVLSYFDPDGLIRDRGLGVVVAGPDQMQAQAQRLLADRCALDEAAQRCLDHMDRHYRAEDLLRPYEVLFESLGRGQGRPGPMPSIVPR
jgi:glycosyltransferase involved in cell wall biosynthesis